MTRLLFSTACALVALFVAATQPGFAQSSEETGVLAKEIESLKKGQAAIQKDLREIKKLLQQRLRPGRTRQARPFTPKDIDLAGAAVRGAADAPVTLVEFTDYQCPFCRRHFSNVMPRIEKEYVATGKLRYMLKEFPIPSLHPGAPKAAEGALCAGAQGKYWEMHDLIFQNQRAVLPSQLKDRATELGLDVAAFSDCLDGGKYRERVQADMSAGRAAGVSGTPSFFLGRTDPKNPDKIKATKFIRGAQGYAAFKKVIDELLKQGS